MAENREKDRLPPGQNRTREMPVHHVGQVPHFDPASWDLKVQGLVESPVTLDHRAFLALPRVERVVDFHCVATWTRIGVRFSGALVRDLVREARPLEDAKHVVAHADGGYSANLLLEEVLGGDVLVADEMDGEPLAPEHGFPARLVVPGKYAWKSAKWLRSIELLSEVRPGFWESRGYHPNADAAREERFAENP